MKSAKLTMSRRMLEATKIGIGFLSTLNAPMIPSVFLKLHNAEQDALPGKDISVNLEQEETAFIGTALIMFTVGTTQGHIKEVTHTQDEMDSYNQQVSDFYDANFEENTNV